MANSALKVAALFAVLAMALAMGEVRAEDFCKASCQRTLDLCNKEPFNPRRATIAVSGVCAAPCDAICPATCDAIVKPCNKSCMDKLVECQLRCPRSAGDCLASCTSSHKTCEEKCDGMNKICSGSSSPCDAAKALCPARCKDSSTS